MNPNRHISRIILFALIAIAGVDRIQAQQFEWLSEDFPDSHFVNIFEINGKYYGAVSNKGTFVLDTNTMYQLSMYELELYQQGEPDLQLYKIATLPFPENYVTIELAYIKETNVWIIVQSAIISEERQRYRAILCNEYFDILAEQNIDTSGYPIAFYIDSYNGKTYVLGSILGPPHKLFFLQYSHSNPYYLPPIEVNQSEPRETFAVTSMNIDYRTGDMLVFYYGGITELDSNLHQDLRLTYDDIQTAYHGSVLGTETNYFSHSLADRESGSFYKYLVFQKYDTLFNVLVADTLGKENKDYYPFLTKSLDYRNNEFLVGGHIAPLTSLDFDKSIKKFYLSKFDKDMNQLWYKEYGGDRAYVLEGLKLLEDGSSLAYGHVTDTLDDIWYAYIMYVDKNGDILNSSSTPFQPQVSIQIVNPGDENLHILNPEGIHARIELYDMNGRLVNKSELHEPVTEIDTRELPFGIYPYTFIQNGNIIGSGKWIKGN